ncbi:MAG: hypothetical protein RSC18_05085 [Raoultibacter sp.]
MTEKKQHPNRKFVAADSGKSVDAPQQATEAAEVEKTTPDPAGGKNVFGMRIASAILWVLAIVFEVLAVLVMNGTIYLQSAQVWMIVALVLDLICVVIASQIWKRANHIDPPSKAEKVKFFIQNQLGAIMSILAFLPFIILVLVNKDADKKTKQLATIVAAVALVIAGASSIDYHPASAEDQQAAATAAATYGDGTVYWTTFGKVYHLDPNCQAIVNSGTIFTGTVQEAFDAKRNRACSFCAEEATKSASALPANETIDAKPDADKTEKTDVKDAEKTDTSKTEKPDTAKTEKEKPAEKPATEEKKAA